METSIPTAVLNPKKQLRDNLQSENFKLAISELKSKYITADRMVRIALNAINRIPELAECTQPSFFSALMRLTEVGLEPDGYHAHLIPYNNKVKGSNPPKYRKECQLIIDYKGLVTVIRRNPAIAVVKGAVVYEHDKFTYREGSDRYFEHEPAWIEGDSIKGAYSFVKFAQINDWELSYVPIWEIESIRKRSRASDRGPWVTDYAQMCIKTALRRHAKMLPLTAEEQRATLIDDDTMEVEEATRRLPQRTAEFRKGTRADDGRGYDSVSEEEMAGARPENSHFGVQESEPPQPEEEEMDGRSLKNKADLDAKKSEEEEEIRRELERVRAEFRKPFEDLNKLMAKNSVTDTEVIFVLNDFAMAVGQADQTGLVGDLPFETVKVMPKQWPTLLHAINQKRKAAAGEIK